LNTAALVWNNSSRSTRQDVLSLPSRPNSATTKLVLVVPVREAETSERDAAMPEQTAPGRARGWLALNNFHDIEPRIYEAATVHGAHRNSHFRL
jgi:hypothetical protein